MGPTWTTTDFWGDRTTLPPPPPRGGPPTEPSAAGSESEMEAMVREMRAAIGTHAARLLAQLPDEEAGLPEPPQTAEPPAAVGAAPAGPAPRPQPLALPGLEGLAPPGRRRART